MALYLNARDSTIRGIRTPFHAMTSRVVKSPRIALKHDLQATDADFTRAAESTDGNGAENGARGAQKAAQPGRVENRRESQEGRVTPSKCATFAALCDTQLLTKKGLSGEDRRPWPPYLPPINICSKS